MNIHPLLTEKIKELTAALQHQGLWRKNAPAWVKDYNVGLMVEADFFEWLQFFYLPHILVCGKPIIKLNEPLIMLQAKKYLSTKTNYEPVIQLLIEMDAL